MTTSIIGFSKNLKTAKKLKTNTPNSFIELLDNKYIVKCNINHSVEYQKELDNMFN